MTKHNPYIKLGLLALILGHGIAAFTSFGFHHPDEHFQILEWANYFVGNTPDGSHLPWEFASQIRPWFQPMIHAFFIKLFTVMGIYEPFSAAVFFRLAYAFANIWSLLALWNHFQKKHNLSDKWFLILGSMWFFPYIHVRTSSENLAGIFTCFALLSLVRSPSSYFKAGLLFGFAFITRNQIALGLAGLAAALLIQDRGIRKGHWILFSGFLIPVGIGTLLDRWGYGNWVFTPYRYYKINIVQNVAASFNPYPWYQYLIWVVELLPFISIPLFYGMLRFSFKNRLNLFGWFSLSFFFLHWLITNKEYRFLFPVLNFVPLMAFAYYQNHGKLKSFGGKPVVLASYLILSVLAFGASSLHGASFRMLGAHYAVYAVSPDYPGSIWISNRNFTEAGKFSMPYYDLKKVKGFDVDNVHAFETISGMKDLLKQYPKSLILIDGYADSYLKDVTQTVQSLGCKLVYNPINSRVSKYIRTPYQVVYHCGSN
jgi:phosphatidylinositol glycan class B